MINLVMFVEEIMILIIYYNVSFVKLLFVILIVIIDLIVQLLLKIVGIV